MAPERGREDRSLPQADAAVSLSDSRSTGRNGSVGQAREPSAGRIVQGPRWRQSGCPDERARACSRRHRRVDRQPRSVGCLRVTTLRGGGSRVRSGRSQSGQGSGDEGHGGRGDLPWSRLRRRGEHCESLASAHGYRYIHSGNEPHLVEGVGTYTLEIMAEQPDIDTVIVPIGGGSGASGACIAGKGVKPELTVIGVQAAAAPAAYRSWKERRLIDDEMKPPPRGLRPAPPSSCRSRSCGRCSMTSSSSLRTR